MKGVTIKGNPSSNRVRLVLKDDAKDRYMAHYFHFVEYIIFSIWVLEHYGLSNSDVKEIYVIGDDERFISGNHHDINKYLVHHLFPLATFGLAREGHSFDNTKMREFTISRHDADHRSINKMCAALFSCLTPEVINSYLLPLTVPSETRENTTVTYAARRNGPRTLPERVSRKLTSQVGDIEGVALDVVYWEDLCFEDQIRKAASTDVLIGIHGNNLTNLIFMKPGTLVVEIMPKGFFAYDYYGLCRLKGIEYYAVSDHVLAPAEYKVSHQQNRPVKRTDISAIVAIIRNHMIFNSGSIS